MVVSCLLVLQATRETLKRHITEFGDQLRKDNEVGLVVDGQVCLLSMNMYTVLRTGLSLIHKCNEMTILIDSFLNEFKLNAFRVVTQNPSGGYTFHPE